MPQELKELRHRCKMAEEESATQSSARADMQDRLQAALDAIASGSEMAENTAIAELRRQVDELKRQLAAAEAAAAAAEPAAVESAAELAVAPAPAEAGPPLPPLLPVAPRRTLGQMGEDELREELTIFAERVRDAKGGAVDVGLEGAADELQGLARQLRHLLPEGPDGLSPRTALAEVPVPADENEDLTLKVKRLKHQLNAAENETRTTTKHLAHMSEGRRLAEQELKTLKEEMSQLKKEMKVAQEAAVLASAAAKNEEGRAARQEAKASKAVQGEAVESRRLADKWKVQAETAAAKLQVAKEGERKYREEKTGLLAQNKALTKQIKVGRPQPGDLISAHPWTSNAPSLLRLFPVCSASVGTAVTRGGTCRR